MIKLKPCPWPKCLEPHKVDIQHMDKIGISHYFCASCSLTGPNIKATLKSGKWDWKEADRLAAEAWNELPRMENICQN